MGKWTDGLTTGEKFAFNRYYMADPYLKKIQDDTLPVPTLADKARRILRLNLRTNMDTETSLTAASPLSNTESNR